MRNVRFLLAPQNYNLYLDEIIDYADAYTSVPVEDLGLKLKLFGLIVITLMMQ